MRRNIAVLLMVAGIVIVYWAMTRETAIYADGQATANLQLMGMQLASVIIGCSAFIGGCALFAPPPAPPPPPIE